MLLKDLFHARRGPEKVDRRGAGRGDGCDDGLEFVFQKAGCREFRAIFQLGHAQGDAIGGGDADGRGAADDHVLDAAGHFQVAAMGDELFFAGQQALVEHDHGAVFPFDDWMHGLSPWLRAVRIILD